LARYQLASEGLDHSYWSSSRQSYLDWAAETLRLAGGSAAADLAARVAPALEQLHQAPMTALPGAEECLASLKAAGFTTAVCSNWGWDLQDDLVPTGLAPYIDVFVSSAQAGCRKPHPRIYQATIEAGGFGAERAVFVGDSPRTDVYGPRAVGIRAVLLSARPAADFAGESAESLAAVARSLTST
jgi:putative hydrolase of the HAD superfamily